jgi:hypothetical protein
MNGLKYFRFSQEPFFHDVRVNFLKDATFLGIYHKTEIP